MQGSIVLSVRWVRGAITQIFLLISQEECDETRN